MVKTPKMRHSKSRREPVTIELEPGAVSRIADEDAAKPQAVAEETLAEIPEEPVHADQTDLEPWEHADAAAAGAAEAGAPTDAGPKPPNRRCPIPVRMRPLLAPRPSTTALKTQPPDHHETKEAPGKPRRGAKSMAVQPKRGGLNGIAAGIIGGVIALVGAGGLQFAGLLGAPGSGSGVSLDGVNSEIASLKTEIAGLKETSGNTDASAKVDGLSAALDQVKTTSRR